MLDEKDSWREEEEGDERWRSKMLFECLRIRRDKVLKGRVKGF